MLLAVLVFGACKSAPEYRREADEVAQEILTAAQIAALDKAEPIIIESPADTLRRRLLLDQELPYSTEASLATKSLEPLEEWPDSEDYLEREGPNLPQAPPVLRINLLDSLQIGAANSRDFQSQKENVFREALDLDLESDAFRTTFTGMTSGEIEADLDAVTDANGRLDDRIGIGSTTTMGFSQRLKNGALITSSIGVDLVKLLTLGEEESRGMFADASISIPLLRGAGAAIVTEPLTQAQRDVIYAIFGFERFKRNFAVDIASSYLSVLQQLDEVQNAEENYKGLVAAGRRARRLADAGRLPEIQVDQALQDELRARDRWIRAQQSYASRLDQFKIQLGLPTDASVELDRTELETLTQQTALLAEVLSGPQVEEELVSESLPADAPIVLEEPDRVNIGPYEMEEEKALALALDKRLDLRTAAGRVYDAQRQVYVAADRLQAELTFNANGSAGGRQSIAGADSLNNNLYFDQGNYSGALVLDFPFERTEERNLYRNSFINLERAVRDLQELEDQVKLQVRNNLRDLLEFRESLRIQKLSLELARRRVESTNLFLQAGRAEIRDLLEAQEALISAQNALTSALVSYRIAELELQRDLGVLEVSGEGLWQEYLEEEENDES